MNPDNNFSRGRWAAAVLIGLAGAFFIWWAVPYNNVFMKNSLVSDNYMPEIVLALLSLLVLAVNPLAGWIRASWRLTTRQIALVLGIWLMAAVVPGEGLMGSFPHTLAKATQNANTDMALAEAHKAMGLPPSLFPDRLEMGKPTPVADRFLGEPAGPNEPIPWRAWVRPLAAWGPLIVASWVMMMGLGMILFPQWRERERLSFPLLTMYEALIEAPEPGRRFPPVVTRGLFWIGAGTVLILHSFNGLEYHTHGGFPGFPLSWNFWQLFQDGMLRNAPWTLRGGQIYFTLIGIVYFMPNRISFSIWFGCVVFAVYLMLKWTYFPVLVGDMVELDFKTGAWILFGLAILWIGRAHWRQVGRAMVSRGRDGEAIRDRTAGWLFLGGALAMFGWFLWVGLSVGASAGFVLFGVMISLLASRIVCEAGLPLLNFSPFMPVRFISFFPRGWWSNTAVYMCGYMAVLFNFGSRICAAVMSCLGMGLDPERPPREQSRVAYLLLAVLGIGILVAGAVLLNIVYTHTTAIDGQSAMGGISYRRMLSSMGTVSQFHAGVAFTPPMGQRWPSLILGALVAAGLMAGCLSFPRWPIHPIALLFVGSFIGDAIWPSIFFGWLLKTLITKYGGARSYRAAQPLFIGLVMGEVFAVVVWTVVPVLMILFGSDPTSVGHVRVTLDM